MLIKIRINPTGQSLGRVSLGGAGALMEKQMSPKQKEKNKLDKQVAYFDNDQNWGSLTVKKRVLTKELKFRGMISGLDKLKLSAGTEVQGDKTMTHLGYRSKQKLNYQNWSIRSQQENS